MPKKPDHLGCPNCGHNPSKVVSVVKGGEGDTILRRRHCPSCDHRWYTLQEPELLLPKHAVSFYRKDGNAPAFTINR